MKKAIYKLTNPIFEIDYSDYEVANLDKSVEKERVLKIPSFISLDEALYNFISKPISL